MVFTVDWLIRRGSFPWLSLVFVEGNIPVTALLVCHSKSNTHPITHLYKKYMRSNSNMAMAEILMFIYDTHVFDLTIFAKLYYLYNLFIIKHKPLSHHSIASSNQFELCKFNLAQAHVSRKCDSIATIHTHTHTHIHCRKNSGYGRFDDKYKSCSIIQFSGMNKCDGEREEDIAWTNAYVRKKNFKTR